MSKQTVKVMSHAKWTKARESHDVHYRKDNKKAIEFAFAIADSLRGRFRFKECEIRGYCEDSWVTIDGTRYNFITEVDSSLLDKEYSE